MQKKMRWFWKDLDEIYTQGGIRNTFISFKPSGMVILSPDMDHGYYEILNDILTFVPKEKVDSFTIEIAKKSVEKLRRKNG